MPSLAALTSLPSPRTQRFAGSSANLHAMNSHDNLHRPPSHSNLRNVMSSGELNKRSNPQSGRGSIDEVRAAGGVSACTCTWALASGMR